MSNIGSSQPSRVLLISPDYLVSNSPINENVEQKLLAKCIRTAEDKYLMPIVGSNLYTTIINMISGGTMPAGDYKNLLDLYVSPALVEYSTLEFITFNSFKIRNKGVQRQTGENSETVAPADLSYLSQSVRDSAEFYSNRLIQFLKANIQSYPEYYQYTSYIDSITPARSDYFSGIQFPNSNRGNCGTFGMGTSTDVTW